MHLVYNVDTRQSAELDVGFRSRWNHLQSWPVVGLGFPIRFQFETEVHADVPSVAGLVIGFAQDDLIERSNVSISLSVYLARPSHFLSIPWLILPWARFLKNDYTIHPTQRCAIITLDHALLGCQLWQCAALPM